MIVIMKDKSQIETWYFGSSIWKIGLFNEIKDNADS